MNLPDYNSEGKKLTWQQHMKKKEKLKEAKRAKEDVGIKDRSGRCQRCDNASFSHRCANGVVTRICNNCGGQKDF